MSGWVDVSPLDALPRGSRKLVEVDGVMIAVFHLDDAFYAIEDVCTHDGGELAHGLVEDGVIICPRHGARFSIKTGAVLAPPAYEPVATFPVRIDNGMVQVRDARWD